MAKHNTWLRKIGSGFKSLFMSTVGNLWNRISGNGLTSAQIDTMNYNAYQAEVDRRFQSAEAEKARQWQEDYYNQYESPQAKIRQYQDAGLNPALLYGGATSSGSVPSTSVPSGAQASSAMPDHGESLLSFIAQMMSVKSVINKNNADAAAANANARNTEQLTDWQPKMWESQLATNEVNRANMRAGIELLQAQTQQIFKNIELTDAQISKVLAEADNIAVDTAKKELEKQGVEINNKLLAAKVLQTFAETRLAEAQTVLAQSNATSVDLDNFQKSLVNDQSSRTGVASSKTFPELLQNVSSQISIRLENGLSSLWNKIF